MSNPSLSGRRWLVTGGNKGIGLAIAREAKRQGARLAIVGRDATRMQAATEELDATAITADLSDPSEAARVMQEATDALGGLDTLINNAGVGARAPLEEVTAENFQRVLATNVISPALLAQAALPHFESAGGGDVVNVASTAGVRGYEGGTIYAASKFALRGMGQCWQAELRKKNVRVLTFNPSYVHTGFSSGADPVDERPHHLQAEDVAHLLVAGLTLPSRAFPPEMTLFATNPWQGEG